MQAPSPNRTAADLSRTARRQWIAFALALLLITIAALHAAGVYGRSAALSALEEQGHADASLKVALLRAVLERPRALPFLLSRDRDVTEALAGSDSARRSFLDRKLEELVAGTSAAVIYVIDTKGVAISASNWREPTSFVGNDYSFRAYFSRAMKDGTAEHFALGSVSKRPGLYISHRIGPAAAPLGVVVVKMEFDQLERDWHETRRPSYIVDADHVVLITSIPSWRFMTTEPLPAENLAAIRESLQFGEAPLTPLPFERMADGLLRAVQPGGGAETYLRITAPVVSTPWQFEYLVPVAGPVSAGMREAQLLALIAIGVTTIAAAIWLRRRQTSLANAARDQAARDELERRVIERTMDLSLARDHLQVEIAEHRETETKLQAVQQDLVQANRLAILGQVAAGVAHEINQPLATIRAYADNSKVFLARSKPEPVLENLGLIADLTDRIATITEDLKALARKGRSGEEPVVLQEVIDGAIMLLRSRFTGRLERLIISPMPQGLAVLGNRLRLEQVFINLFQNALEAVAERTDGRVDVSIAVTDGEVAISVADNGPGISPTILGSLFEPFNTSKEKGLGLGLVIAKDIVSDYGGRLEVETDAGGACFKVHLRKVLP
ncbi:GHKL domain-containing protein [Shinella kummerowiae]|jgi:two-component system C4-dicarboxylate transport sensor histidine kinase DctB|uniref:C4-dicarboxylate transport sensor protein n=1 Tax=Shinella kummerowiae TaxID=417745 RepID=A0A6N8SKP7_9HYPH|nr:ATP-binding protein [Shinella kummerowiae]MXN48318.1 GHKL domain-containing protein [Shinella kummerowiae]